MTRLDPPSGFDGETELSFSLLGGAKLRFRDRLAVRIQGRWISTGMGSGEIFCRSGSCLVDLDSNRVDQLEASVGLVIEFR